MSPSGKKKKSSFLQKFLQQFESYTPHKQGNVSTVIDCAVFFNVFNGLNIAIQLGKAILKKKKRKSLHKSQKTNILEGPAGTKKRYNKKPFDVPPLRLLCKLSVFIVN